MGEESTVLLGRICAATAGEQRTKDLEALNELIRKGEIRDETFTEGLYKGFFLLLSTAYAWRSKEAQDDVCAAERAFLGATRVPEFQPAAVERLVEDHFLRALYSRLDGTAPQEEWPLLRDLLIWFYGHFPAKRGQLRGLIGRTLRSASSFAHKAAPVAPLLEMLLPVIRGFRDPLTGVHRSFLFDVLMPLHRSNEWLQWDRQTPMIGMYHKELVHCVMAFLEKQPSLAPKCIESLCTFFPNSRQANTPKDVLLIYEISKVMKYIDESNFPEIRPALLRHMGRLISSHNSQPIQSVLQYWKDDHILALFQASSEQIIPVILPALLRGGEPHWNVTVNRMTTLVLEKLEASNAELFREVAEDLWGPGRQVPAYITARAEAEAAAAATAGDGVGAPKLPGDGKAANVSSLKFCLGGWKPPGAAGASGGKPPLTATGVAPWAMGGGGGAVGSAGGKQPPLTATGVAPWAFQGGGAGARPGPLSAMSGGAAGGVNGSGAKQAERGSVGGLKPCRENEEEAFEKSGLERVRDYTKVLCPEASGDAVGSDAPWEAALMADSPTLLPSLKFHQLVFGPDDIASGAFSVVRYARTILKEKTQSQWPEYAVKVIDTKTIQEHGYEASVNREICVLKILSHPGIARMVSAFRYREGAYLVLEYAAKGDLHTILVQQGPLPEATARFFIGEVVAALAAIHEAGFVYSDLKPENIVITATGHAKLTDFGGCRPVTAEARQRTRYSLLKRLRDGDWRAKDSPEDESTGPDIDEADALASVDDHRVEGTTLYLPPEVVKGAPPTIACDAWALGCVTFQLLTGKPPIWAESEREEDLKHHIVTFNLADSGSTLEGVPESARGLIGRLLEPDVGKRYSVEAAGADPFFNGEDVFRLYMRPRGPEVAAGRRAAAAPSGDARWHKRQFSKIWTVMPSPEDYQLAADVTDSRGRAAAACTAAPADFTETDAERGESFTDEAMFDSLPGPGRIESL